VLILLRDATALLLLLLLMLVKGSDANVFVWLLRMTATSNDQCSQLNTRSTRSPLPASRPKPRRLLTL